MERTDDRILIGRLTQQLLGEVRAGLKIEDEPDPPRLDSQPTLNRAQRLCGQLLHRIPRVIASLPDHEADSELVEALLFVASFAHWITILIVGLPPSVAPDFPWIERLGEADASYDPDAPERCWYVLPDHRWPIERQKVAAVEWAIPVLLGADEACSTSDTRASGQRKTESGSEGTVEERMRALLEVQHDANGWTSRKFAAALSCSASTVVNTETWKTLAEQKEASRLARQLRDSRKRDA